MIQKINNNKFNQTVIRINQIIKEKDLYGQIIELS